MEQNEINTQNTLSAAQPDVNESGAIPTTPAEPVPVVPEPEMATSVPVESKVNNRNNKKQLVVLALVLCLLLAIGGIGFGIWAMMDSNVEINRLNTEVESLKSKNAELEQQIAEIDETMDAEPEAREWASTEVRDGIFYVLDAGGEVIKQSETSWPKISETVSCESDAENTILNCIVNTAEGEAELMYDAFGDTLSLTIGTE